MKAKFLLYAVIVASASTLLAQAPAPAPYPGSSQSSSNQDMGKEGMWASNLGNDPVGIGDLLYVTVSGSSEMCRSYRVDAQGSIELVLTHNPLHVAGMTSDQIGSAIAAQLKEEHILVEPIVSVVVLDFRSRQVVVAGAVKQPGVMQVVGKFTVLDALSKAQGVAPEAGPEAILTRPASDGQPAQVLRIELKPLMEGQTPEKNYELHGGDELRVPEAQKIYLVGNLKLPGSYPVNDPNGTTVLKALAMSQGQLPFTTRQAYIYRTVNGQRNEISVPLHDILRRKAPDVPLLPNDILYVPEAGGKHLTATVIDRLTGLGGQIGSEALIWSML